MWLKWLIRAKQGYHAKILAGPVHPRNNPSCRSHCSGYSLLKWRSFLNPPVFHLPLACSLHLAWHTELWASAHSPSPSVQREGSSSLGEMGKSGDMRVQPFHGETGRQPELSASQSLVPPGPKPMGTQTKPAPPCPLPVGKHFLICSCFSFCLSWCLELFQSFATI